MADLSSTNIFGELKVSGKTLLNNDVSINFKSDTALTGQDAYGGLHFLQQPGTNDHFVGITTSATSSGTQGGILFQGSGAYGTKIHFLTTDTYASGMKQRMIIDQRGYVGIGTTSPSSLLHVAGTVTAPTFSGSLSGNATTATTLQTARTINGTSFNGSANITTANWGTARTLTIGNTGKSVNGSGNVSWSLAEIGAEPVQAANRKRQIFVQSSTPSGAEEGSIWIKL